MAGIGLDNKVDVDAKDVEGWTALLYVAKVGSLEILEILFDSGLEIKADVSAQPSNRWTALHLASENGH